MTVRYQVDRAPSQVYGYQSRCVRIQIPTHNPRCGWSFTHHGAVWPPITTVYENPTVSTKKLLPSTQNFIRAIGQALSCQKLLSCYPGQALHLRYPPIHNNQHEDDLHLEVEIGHPLGVAHDGVEVGRQCDCGAIQACPQPWSRYKVHRVR